MKLTYVCVLLAGSSLILAGCQKSASAPAANNQAASESKSSEATSSDPIKSAESAAPASIAHNASVITVGADGKVNELRKGSNG